VGPYRLTSLSPTRVSTVGGTTVTVTGEAIPAGALVRVGATGSATVVSVSTTRLTFTAPALAAGTYDVYVFGPDRTTYSVLTGALQYVAPDGRTGTPGTGTPGTGTPGTGTDPGFVTGPNGERLVRSASWAALAPRIWKVACSAACSGISV